MTDFAKVLGYTAPGGGGVPVTVGGTEYELVAQSHSNATIPTWTTYITHTLSDDFCYISEFWNTSTSTSYTYSWYWRILVDDVEIFNSYTDLATTALGRCWPSTSSTTDQWMPIGSQSWTMFTHPWWAKGSTVKIQFSPTNVSTTQYISCKARFVDMALS